MRTITLRANVIVILALAALFPVGRLLSEQRQTYLALGDSIAFGFIGGEQAEMRIHVNAHVFDDGTANGPLQVRVVDGNSFLYRAVEGEVTLDEQGTIVEMILALERVGEDGVPTGETDRAIIRPSSTIQDCLIYDFVGPAIHVEAEGTLGFRHEHVRP